MNFKLKLVFKKHANLARDDLGGDGLRYIAFVILFIANILYIAYFSSLSLMRMWSLNASVYDLGVAMEQGWLVFHTHWTLHLFISDFGLYSGRFLLSPLFILANFSLILVVQTVAIAIPSFFVYGIALKFIGKRLPSLLISLSYLIYFPLAGMNLFDFHYMAFFPLFFLAAVYYYFDNKYTASLILFLVAGLVKFPFIAFSAGFLILEGISHLRAKEFNLLPENKRKTMFIISGVLLFMLVFAISYYSVSLFGVSSYLHSGPFQFSNVRDDIDNKIFTLLLIFMPFLALPLWSKYSLLLIPIMAFALFFTNGAFMFPGLFHDQYSAILVPFVYLALIDGLVNLSSGSDSIKHMRQETTSENIRSDKDLKKIDGRFFLKVSVALIISMILFALVFQPYGPLNASSQDDYHLSAIKSYNYTVYENMLKVASLIPKNVSASEILVENNIPFIFPRVDSYGLNVSNPLTAPLEVDYNYNFFYNFTELGPDGEYIPIVPEYIIMYPYGGMYNQGYWGYAGTDGPYPHNISNAALIDHLVSTHHYGMVAEASGIFLLELNYSGPLRFYVPFNYYYPPNYFNTYPDSSLTMAGITGTDIRNGGLFWGQTVLLPGTYNITFSFTGTSQSSNNSLILNVAHDNGLIDLASRTIYPHNLTSLDNFNVTFTVSTERILAYTIYSVWVPNWEGTITFTGIHVTQIKPPGQN